MIMISGGVVLGVSFRSGRNVCKRRSLIGLSFAWVAGRRSTIIVWQIWRT